MLRQCFKRLHQQVHRLGSEAVTLSGSFLDVGVLDTHAVTIDWKDGSPPELFALPLGARSFSDISHRFPDRLDFAARTYEVEVTLAGRR